jgi:hypothetical protein
MCAPPSTGIIEPVVKGDLPISGVAAKAHRGFGKSRPEKFCGPWNIAGVGGSGRERRLPRRSRRHPSAPSDQFLLLLSPIQPSRLESDFQADLEAPEDIEAQREVIVDAALKFLARGDGE